MRFGKDFKPELCVSTDPIRKRLHYVHYDPAKSRLTATDAAAAVFVPCVRGDEDPTGPILLDTGAIKACRKAAKKEAHVTVHADAGATRIPGGPVYPHGEAAQDFPPVDRVVPKFKPDDEGTVTVALNPKLLSRLAEAMGAADGVEITISLSDTRGPMLVMPIFENGATGVLMPRGRAKPE